MRNSTDVSAAKRVNSTGLRASARVCGLTWMRSQIAGTMKRTSLRTNWKACT
jgi:hypothetical protein